MSDAQTRLQRIKELLSSIEQEIKECRQILRGQYDVDR